MDMRVQRQVLPSSVQNGYRPDFNPVMRIPKTTERIPYRFEQQAVIHFVVPQTNIVQAVRGGKNDMIMLYGQSFLFQLPYPQYLFV
jgi:hypothetical protein